MPSDCCKPARGINAIHKTLGKSWTRTSWNFPRQGFAVVGDRVAQAAALHRCVDQRALKFGQMFAHFGGLGRLAAGQRADQVHMPVRHTP